MNISKLVGALLLALGILALVYRGITYTKETHEAKIGRFELTWKDRERIEIPVWLGAGLAVAGGVLLARQGKGHPRPGKDD